MALAICDPMPLVRNGLRAACEPHGFAVEENPIDIVKWSRERPKAFIVLSISSTDDWNLLKRLQAQTPDTSVVSLLDRPSVDSYRRALRSGARSVIARSAPVEDIVSVLRCTSNGNGLVPSAALSVNAVYSGALTDEETHWLSELARGVSIEDLARTTSYSRRTMFRRLNVMYRKLGVNRRQHALVAATHRGVI